jgi:hypothetical protein
LTIVGTIQATLPCDLETRSAPVARFICAFCGVDVLIDHLKVWQAPIPQQLRPRRVSMIAPHSKQRDAMVNLGGLPKTPAGLAAAPRLQAP